MEGEARDFGTRLIDGVIGLVVGVFIGFVAMDWMNASAVTVIGICGLGGLALGFCVGPIATEIMLHVFWWI